MESHPTSGDRAPIAHVDPGWLFVLAGAGLLAATMLIPAMPLNDIRSLLDDPHLNDAEFFKFVEHPTEGRLRMTQVPGRWSGSPRSRGSTIRAP